MIGGFPSALQFYLILSQHNQSVITQHGFYILGEEGGYGQYCSHLLAINKKIKRYYLRKISVFESYNLYKKEGIKMITIFIIVPKKIKSQLIES